MDEDWEIPKHFRSIQAGYSIQKQIGHLKNASVKQALYNWVSHHPQVVQSPTDNDCLKVSIDGQNEKQLFPKLLLNVDVRELHNSMASTP